MTGVFALKGNALVFSFSIPLPALTFVFYKFIRNNFDRSTVYLNLSLVKEIKTPEKEFLKVQCVQQGVAENLPDIRELPDLLRCIFTKILACRSSLSLRHRLKLVRV
jgi:hypothetical protein